MFSAPLDEDLRYSDYFFQYIVKKYYTDIGD